MAGRWSTTFLPDDSSTPRARYARSLLRGNSCFVRFEIGVGVKFRRILIFVDCCQRCVSFRCCHDVLARCVIILAGMFGSCLVTFFEREKITLQTFAINDICTGVVVLSIVIYFALSRTNFVVKKDLYQDRYYRYNIIILCYQLMLLFR